MGLLYNENVTKKPMQLVCFEGGTRDTKNKTGRGVDFGSEEKHVAGMAGVRHLESRIGLLLGPMSRFDELTPPLQCCSDQIHDELVRTEKLFILCVLVGAGLT